MKTTRMNLTVAFNVVLSDEASETPAYTELNNSFALNYAKNEVLRVLEGANVANVYDDSVTIKHVKAEFAIVQTKVFFNQAEPGLTVLAVARIIPNDDPAKPGRIYVSYIYADVAAPVAPEHRRVVDLSEVAAWGAFNKAILYSY